MDGGWRVEGGGGVLPLLDFTLDLSPWNRNQSTNKRKGVLSLGSKLKTKIPMLEWWYCPMNLTVPVHLGLLDLSSGTSGEQMWQM